MMKTFNQMSHSGDYKGDEVSVSITVLGGTYGGGERGVGHRKALWQRGQALRRCCPHTKEEHGRWGGNVPMVIEPIAFRDDVTIKVGGGGIAFQLDTMHRQQCIMQNTTGTLSPGAHPGSYNGQDAYNDLLVVNDGNNNNKPQRLPHESGDEWCSGLASSDRIQRPTDSDEIWGGW